MTSETYSNEYNWVPKATMHEDVTNLAWVPKDVLLPQTSKSNKEGNTTQQLLAVQSSNKWDWQTKQKSMTQNLKP